MNHDAGHLWVELVGDVIVARVRGMPTVELIQACQGRVLSLLQDTGCRRVLYDALEMERPPVDIAVVQQGLTSNLKAHSARIALVVPNTALAYLARLAFGESDHRVFYNDIAGAFAWLAQGQGK